MTIGDLSVGLNMPAGLKSTGSGDSEFVHGLPPYRPRRAFLVDEYPACPASWMRSTGRIKSYFVPIVEGAGLWLDFNGCAKHANHSAVVVSVQGVNAITGLPCKDAQLELYRDECPKHKEPFGPDRLCKRCGFRWPRQNYLSSAGTPQGQFWLDGFRAEDGNVRQYIFTEQKMRGVAAAIIGEERVFALGISFFLSKQPKPPQATHVLRGWHGLTGIACASVGGMNSGTSVDNLAPDDTVANFMSCAHEINEISYTASASNSNSTLYERKLSSPKVPTKEVDMSMVNKVGALGAKTGKNKLMRGAGGQSISVKKMEVAAGARIDQKVYDDPNDLEFWQKEPEGLIVINYCLESECEAILAAGKVDVSGSPEGFLQNVPKGN